MLYTLFTAPLFFCFVLLLRPAKDPCQTDLWLGLTKSTDWTIHCFIFGFVFETFTAIVSRGLGSVDASRLSVSTVSWLVAFSKTDSLFVHPSPNMCPHSSFFVSCLGGMGTKLRHRVFLVEHHEASQPSFLGSSPCPASICFFLFILSFPCQKNNEKVCFRLPDHLLRQVGYFVETHNPACSESIQIDLFASRVDFKKQRWIKRIGRVDDDKAANEIKQTERTVFSPILLACAFFVCSILRKIPLLADMTFRPSIISPSPHCVWEGFAEWPYVKVGAAPPPSALFLSSPP